MSLRFSLQHHASKLNRLASEKMLPINMFERADEPMHTGEPSFRGSASAALAVVAALVLAGCSSGTGLLDPKSNVPQAANVPVGNKLALPPDLQLSAPQGTYDAYQPNGAVASAGLAQPEPGLANINTARATASPTQSYATAPIVANRKGKKLASSGTGRDVYGNVGGAEPVAARPLGSDVFAQYGISKTKPDGTPKSIQQMNDELAEVLRRKKREANPNYGTVFNIGEVFKE